MFDVLFHQLSCIIFYDVDFYDIIFHDIISYDVNFYDIISYEIIFHEPWLSWFGKLEGQRGEWECIRPKHANSNSKNGLDVSVNPPTGGRK